jgi:mRNA interferase YafO
MIRIFKSQIILQQLSPEQLEQLVTDFRIYKESNLLPDTFGRDVKYDIHLTDREHLWPLHLVQFKRTSDIHLVYCQGATDSSHFLLIAILMPNAHEQARQNNVMANIGKMAERFRQSH